MRRNWLGTVLWSIVGLGLLSIPASGQTARPAAAPSGTQEPEVLGTRDAELIWARVIVSDLAKSHEFYSKVIGLKIAIFRPGDKPPDPKGNAPIGMNFSGSRADAFFVIMKREGAKLAPETTGQTTIGFKVPDTMAVVARAKAGGYKVDRVTESRPGMLFAYIYDPDGYLVEVIQGGKGTPAHRAP